MIPWFVQRGAHPSTTTPSLWPALGREKNIKDVNSAHILIRRAITKAMNARRSTSAMQAYATPCIVNSAVLQKCGRALSLTLRSGLSCICTRIRSWCVSLIIGRISQRLERCNVVL